MAFEVTMTERSGSELGAAGVRVYLVFRSKNNPGEVLMVDSRDEDKKRSDGIIRPEDEFWQFIMSHNWTEAMTRLHEKMGWEPYKPLEEF